MNIKAAILALICLPIAAWADNMPIDNDDSATSPTPSAEANPSTTETIEATSPEAPGDTLTIIDAKGQTFRIPAELIGGGSLAREVSLTAVDQPEVPPLKGPKSRRIDRGIRRETFISKGSWMGGGTFSFSDYENDNLNILVFKDIDGDGYSFSVSPFAGYFFRNDMMIGVRLNYKRSHFDLESFELNLGEDFNISLDNLYWLEQTFEASGIYRTYMSVGRSKVFGLFNEVRLTYAYSSGKNSTGTGTEYDGTHQTAHSLCLGIAPGLTAFVTNRSAVEVSLGVMGYGMKWVDQTTNQVESGKKRSLSGNFRINLFSINIGMTFYL